MGRKGRNKAYLPEPYPGAWMEETHDRLVASREATRQGRAPTLEEFDRALATPLQTYHKAEPVAANAPSVRTPDEAALLLHRRGAEGLMKSGFEPQRHSVMIEGRPVQVP